MVLLTASYVEKECSRTQSEKSLTKGLEKNHLKKITHLYMNNKFISAIGDLSHCKNLKVIYLQNNALTKIENLDFAEKLTNLYLQHNNLTKIDNLGALRNLTKLCLGHNCISVVEGLENLDKLCELHIEKQRLLKGEFLIFEPRTLEALSTRLKLLNVTGTRLTSLRPISRIVRLEILEAKDNLLNDMEDLTESLSSMRMLRELFLQGNPVTQSYRYRESMIANSDSLVNLDGKHITEVSRQFMKKFKEEKQLRQNRRRTKMTLSDDITSSLKLPPAFERSVSRAIIQQHPGPRFTINVTSGSAGSQPQIFPAWKSTTAIAGTKSDNRITPRPFWRGTSRLNIKAPGQSMGTKDTLIFPTIF
ncbi:protein phosphatase 1 regulatory subunit 42-like [Venturia canescens]|uniref:protein phosphatase 1 regulatory subunit 42-like n=1 Tax=Venturia canescens TaxID=32260 RepID=UPI001C9CE991|nr:protein phosphatase 1 regulatory subunit 42-like [Venturia canescens]